MIREIIKIDDDLCNGCGVCVPNCHEGALQIIDGKARLISELMCDGLGACIGHCPEGAITIEEREADAYDEITTISQMVKQGKATMFAHLKHLQDHNETGYLQQALGFIKANREAMPFEIAHGEREAVIDADDGLNAGFEFRDQPLGQASACPVFPLAGWRLDLDRRPIVLGFINPEALQAGFSRLSP